MIIIMIIHSNINENSSNNSISNKRPVGGVVSALVEYERAEEAEVAVASLDERYEIRDGVGRLSVRPAREWAKRARTAQSDRSAG